MMMRLITIAFAVALIAASCGGGDASPEEVVADFNEACERGDFRLVEYSIQADHLHLIVEAESQEAMGRGMKSISARIARAVNRVFERKGAVLCGRYHLELLSSPTQVRNALRYVLLNARKHWRQRHGVAPPVRIDPASSGVCFTGWKGRPPRNRSHGVAHPRSWLLAKGWRRLGLLDPAEVPG